MPAEIPFSRSAATKLPATLANVSSPAVSSTGIAVMACSVGLSLVAVIPIVNDWVTVSVPSERVKVKSSVVFAVSASSSASLGT